MTPRYVATAVLLALSPAPSGSSPHPDRSLWSFAGHRVVCEIAWRDLTSEARTEVRRLTEAYGAYDTFAESCAWADGAEAKRVHNSHWINLARGSDSVAMSDCPADCILRHLEAERVRLADRYENDENRAQALMFLGHFVGDLHNPVHVAYGDDRGGNEHSIDGLGSRTDDLHAVWDNYLLSSRVRDWRGYARELHESIDDAARTSWAESTPLDWANESFHIASTHLYDGLGGAEQNLVPESYLNRNRPRVEERLRQAGVRLSRLLNEALGVTP